MSRNGSGSYSLPAGNPVVTGATISSTTHNNTLTDIASALTDSLAKDGQTTPTANLPMGGYKHTNVADASVRTDYAKVSQIQDGGYVTLSSVSGADTITATNSPAIAAYALGQMFSFVSAGANTGAVTLNINGLGAKAVTKEGTTALAAGDIASGAVVYVEYDGTRFQIVGGRSVQPLDALLTALAGQTTAAAKIQGYSGADAATLYDFKDEDNMASNSATALPSQQSVKAYVDAALTSVAGTEVQYVETVLNTVATGTKLIPDDDTIPQQTGDTEGDEYFTCTITPTSATNKLHIKVIVQIATNNASSYLVAALFQDTTAGALAVGYTAPVHATATDQIVIEYRMDAGTTSATTFKVRAGGTVAGTVTINGQGAVRKFGGAMVSKIMISEIKV